MELFESHLVPNVIQGRVCRQSRLFIASGIVLMFAFLSAFPAFVVWYAEPRWWIGAPVIAFATMMALFLARRCARLFAAGNWSLRIAPDGLWINTRSYLNPDFAAARTVLFVPYQEIADVGEYVVRRAERDSDGVTTWTDRSLEIRLYQPAPTEVMQQISEERRRKVERKYLFGLVTSRSRNNHVPVSIPNDKTLRLAWRGRFDFVVPSLTTTLRELAANCTVRSTLEKDVSDVDQLTGEETDRLVLECVETGDKLGAIKLLRDRRGYTLTEASKFVDELLVRI